MFTKKNLHLGQHIIDYQVYQMICPFQGFGHDLQKNSGVKIDTFIMVKKGRNLCFYMNLPEWQCAGARYFQKVKNKPQSALKIIEKIITFSGKLYDFCQTIPDATRLKRLSDKKLCAIYVRFHFFHHIFWNLAMTPNLLEAENSYLTDYVYNLVAEKSKKYKLNESVTEIFNSLTFFEKRSYLEKKKADYWKLLASLKKGKRSVLIDNFYQKYCWLEYNWSGPPADKKLLLKQISQDLKKKKDYQKNLRLAVRERRLSLQKKARLKRLLKLSPKETLLIHTLERLYFSKGYRMDCSYFGYYQMERVFKEISRRLGLTLNQARSIIPEEMLVYLIKRKIDVSRLNNLYNESVLCWNGKKESIYVGSEARKFISEMSEKDYVQGRDIQCLKGQVAYPGKVTGIVKVVNERADMIKFKKGDILVSGHTDPSLMPAIVKAAALVTDFGGMTCHAAIVSRELKIPCLVGTKIATKVFHDGDKIEVDANSGNVKKL